MAVKTSEVKTNATTTSKISGVSDFVLRDPTSNISWLKPLFLCDLPLNQSIKVENEFAEKKIAHRFNSNTLLVLSTTEPPWKGMNPVPTPSWRVLDGSSI